MLLCITIIGIPFGIQSFKFVPLALFPFGKEIVSAHDLRDEIGIARTSSWAGPVPDRLTRLTFDVPPRLLRELEQASRRRGVPLDQLVIAALYVAATS